MIKVVLAVLALALVAAPAEARSKKNPFTAENPYYAKTIKPHYVPVHPIGQSQVGGSSGVTGSSFGSQRYNSTPPSSSSYSQPSRRRHDSSSY